MVIDRPFTIFLILISVCMVKTQHPSYKIPDFGHKFGSGFISINTNSPNGTIRPPVTTPLSIPPSISPTLYHFTFNFSDTGLRKIGPNFITSDKDIRLIFVNNEISYISPYAFREMQRLKYLDLSMNRIPTERLLLFVEVNELQTLIINNNNPINITKISTIQPNINNSYESELNYGVFKSLEDLHMCHSQLRDFQINFLKMPALTHLYLNNNSIDSSDIVLNNMPNTLRNLFLSNNLIDRVDKYKLRYLQQLIMDNNLIKEVCFEHCEKQFISLRGANYINTLSLSRNCISKISADAFKDTKALSSLDLSGNEITEVAKGTFNNTPRMHNLSLADNKLATIPKDICSLMYLMSLNLSGNHINIVRNFCQLAYLKNLYLANNNIAIIENRAFENLQMLKYLDLSGNQLCQLPSRWVYMNIEELHLERNNFEELDDVGLVNLRKLKDAYLNENPIIRIKRTSISSLVSTQLTLHIKNMQIKNTKYEDKSDDKNDDKSDDKYDDKSDNKNDKNNNYW